MTTKIRMCCDCDWSAGGVTPGGEDVFECRARPPVLRPDNALFNALWPVVMAEDWCREYSEIDDE